MEVRLSTSKSRGPLQLYSDFPLVEEKRVPFCFPVLVLHHLSFLRLFISSTRFPNETCPLAVQGLMEGRYTTNSSASSTSPKSLSSYASLSSSPSICAITGSPRSQIPFEKDPASPPPSSLLHTTLLPRPPAAPPHPLLHLWV